MSKIIAAVSGKGGCGRTMFAVNLASVLAIGGHSVLIIDMNTGMRNVDICLGMENFIIYDLSDVVNGMCRADRAMVRDSRFDDMYLLSASQFREKADITADSIQKICGALSGRFDYIVIDAPCYSDPSWNAAAVSADTAVVVTTQEYAALRDCDMLCRELMLKDSCRCAAVVNRISDKFSKMDCLPGFGEISETLGMPVAGAIQEDINIFLSMNSGVPAVCRTDTYIYRNFLNICGRITGNGLRK